LPGLPAAACHSQGSQAAGGSATAITARPQAGIDRQLQVLILAPTSFFADYGCHIRILLEALCLQRLGHTITICTYRNGEEIAGLPIVRTPGIPWRKDYEVGSSLHKVAFDALLSATSLRWSLRHRPDVIHAHLHEGALIGYALSRLWRVPLILDFQGSLTGEMIDHGFLRAKSPLYRPLLRLERIIDHLPDTLIVSSQHAARLLVSDFGCSEERIHIIPDAVDTELFQPGNSLSDSGGLKRRLGIDPDSLVVVYLGLLAEYQGIALLLKAAQELEDWPKHTHFLIMGHPNVDRYREIAAGMGLSRRVTFTGRIPYDEAGQYLRLGDVAVAPKLSTTEGSGKLPTYMATGLPTVAFDTPVSREYLGQWGVYARKGDHVSLARSIVSVLDDRDGSTALGENVHDRAERLYSMVVLQARLKNLYSEVLARR
jgi:glycosyltransferase involved in cell wall biosynthesis